MIAGRTHPGVAQREGERYRLSLQQRVLDLGLEDHVEFDDRFLTIDEIADLLAATVVFVTPYRDREQISSGALTFGDRRRLRRRLDAVLVCGGYARIGRRRARAVRRSARACRAISFHRGAGAARRGPRRGTADRRAAGWPSVAEATAAVLRERVELAPRARRLVEPRTSQPASMRTDHLRTLVDDVGIVQHAHGVIPNRESGYCVDDVARLAVVALELARRGDEQFWTSIVYRSLAFLHDATDQRPGCATS